MKHPQSQLQLPLFLQDTHKKFLLTYARNTIEQFFHYRKLTVEEQNDSVLNHKRGAFVTLLKQGKLRGCIGHIKDDLPLQQVVGIMALQAAFNDCRFSPVSADELMGIEIEISVLSPLKQIYDMEKIELGRDGILLRKDGAQAVFLPQVSVKMGWNRQQFLDRLCNKMGLPNGSWKKDSFLFIFQAEVFHESQFYA